MVRNFIKLKNILNVLVPQMVRDRVKMGKKSLYEDEGDVTIIFVNIAKFD